MRITLTAVLVSIIALGGLTSAKADVPPLCKQMYTGRTTLLVTDSAPNRGSEMKTKLANVMALATSQRVMQVAATALADLGIRTSLPDLLGRLSVGIVEGTDILRIEVTAQDQAEAKITVDVLAAETKNACLAVVTSSATQECKALQKSTETARRNMAAAYDLLQKSRKGCTKSKLAEMQADAQAAQNVYISTSTHYAEAILQEQRAKLASPLVTLDPGYVFTAQ